MLTTVVPVVVAVGIFIGVAVWWPSGDQTRSVALFDACVATKGYDATQTSFGATIGEQRAAKACRSKLPVAAAQLQGGPVLSAGFAGFEQCMKSLGQTPRGFRRGFGGFRRPSQAYESAEATCRQLQASSRDNSGAPPVTTTTPLSTTTTKSPIE